MGSFLLLAPFAQPFIIRIIVGNISTRRIFIVFESSRRIVGRVVLVIPLRAVSIRARLRGNNESWKSFRFNLITRQFSSRITTIAQQI